MNCLSRCPVTVASCSGPCCSGGRSARCCAGRQPAEPVPAAVTLEQLSSELARLVESSVSSAASEPLLRVAEALTGLQSSLADISSRLDAAAAFQLRVEQAHAETHTRLRSLEESLQGTYGTAAGGSDNLAVTTEVTLGSDEITPDSADVTESGSRGVDCPDGNGTADHQTTATAAPSPPSRVALGQPCLSDTECSEVQPNTECGERRVCACVAGYRQVSAGECRRRSELSQPCAEDADCLLPDAVCADGVCDCVPGFWNRLNTSCRRLSQSSEGGKCAGDPDCDTGLECLSGRCKCKAAVHGQYEFRVAGSYNCSVGTVELRVSGGDWGFVCDDGWGLVDATVFCRSLGFESGKGYGGARYGRGSNFYMDEVDCDGSEPHLLRCAYDGWGRHNCNAGEVSSVVCSHFA
ncbi:Macrophage receptor MARCO [Amphibalanus amphitrite]|uniref:Macrophage receptor MARCO n=1 Tax=Amphibalanus amphitrite TaxID=1232801 RepID=A0A6A4VVH2_AMPAM|nr:Macrophage receptor MARCO [Amphibalanus amphitrite]